MTIKEKVSIFFQAILEEIESINNDAIKAKAIDGITQNMDWFLIELMQAKTKIIKGENNGNS